MAHDIAVLLGGALRTIRKRTARTQDGWQEKTGMSQSYLSAAERGESGWESVRNIAEAVEAAGGDPVDLLRIALAEVDAPATREIVSLFPAAPDHVQQAILTLLRSTAAGAAREER